MRGANSIELAPVPAMSCIADFALLVTRLPLKFDKTPNPWTSKTPAIIILLFAGTPPHNPGSNTLSCG